MPVLIRTSSTLPDWEDMSKRGHNRVMRSVFLAIGEHWQKHHLPRHFQRGAAARYGYQARTKTYKYKKRQAYKTGGAVQPNQDLVFTGTLRTIVVRHQIVRAFPARATINIPGPTYLSSKPKPGSKRPDIGGEITAVAREEFHELDRVGEKAQERGIKRELKTKTHRGK